MRKLNGIHLKHHKNTAACSTEVLAVPSEVVIPMNMNMGAHSIPVVKAGDHVDVGDKIGDTDKFMSAPVHSSVSGTVKEITEIKAMNGVCQAVRIETDGQQTISQKVKKPVINSREDFIAALRESGLTGLGGAGFPTHIKSNPNTVIDTLIINAAECEPYITSDHRQMLEAPEDVIGGIKLVMKWLDIPKAVIGIENNKPDAIKLLDKMLSGEENISVKALPAVYPQGAEKVIIYNITGRMVMERQLPSDQHVIVLNVSTCAYINTYCTTGMPLTERRITVDGDIVKKPCNLMVKIGTPVREILEYAQCDTDRAGKIILGGPMMGMCAYETDIVIGKANNAVLAFEKVSEKTQTNCIRCGRCVGACPIRLMPAAIEKAYNRKDVEALKKLKVTLCMNCGCCTYVCPAGRSLAEVNQLAKAIIPRN